MRTLGILLAVLAGACGDNLNVPPPAVDIELSTPEDMPLRVELEIVDPNGDEVEVTLVGTPENGTLSATEPVYTPNDDFNGTDRFQYQASDGVNSVVADITVTVEPVNDAPTISAIADLTTTVDQPVLIPFGIDDIDSPVADLRTTGASTDETVVPEDNLVFGGSGENRDVMVTPIARGTTTITVFVLDDSDISDVAFTFTVENAAPVAVDDQFTTATGLTVTGLAGALSANDTDADNDPLTCVAQAAAATTLGGTVTVSTDCGFTYDEPGGGIPGQTDTFDYEVTDGMASDIGTVSIDVTN